MTKVKQVRIACKTIVADLNLTNELCETISRHNGNLSPSVVRETIESGGRIYTTFNFYERA